VSSLDSTLRLLDRSNGKLLQSYKHTGYVNITYRIRSTLTAKDTVVLSGSEDGFIYAWDVVTGEMLQKVDHYAAQDPANTRNSKRVVSAVAQKKRDTEWASASGDGELFVLAYRTCLRHVCIACSIS
jgi:mitogen-activated protein kinase organizer 1